MNSGAMLADEFIALVATRAKPRNSYSPQNFSLSPSRAFTLVNFHPRRPV
jgi:hypothetical protein